MLGDADPWGSTDDRSAAPSPPAELDPWASSDDPWTSPENPFSPPTPITEAGYAAGRQPGIVYNTKRFPSQRDHAEHDDRIGTPTRIAYQVIDSEGEVVLGGTADGYEVLIRETPKLRHQIRAVFFEEDRHICALHLQKLRPDGSALDGCFTLRDDEIDTLRNFLDMLPKLDFSNEDRQRIDQSTLSRALATPDAWLRMYENHRDELASLIQRDDSANDILAVSRRRKQLEIFEQLLTDPAFFEEQRTAWQKRGPEAVWQKFFEDNHWIFGLGLGSQLILSWERDRLESVVMGYSVATRGKRVDALMRTAGALSGLAFVEIKTPGAPLIAAYRDPYRSDAYVPGKDVTGGVSQVHATVEAAMESFKGRLEREDEFGFTTGDVAYMVRPKSYLIVGNLNQFVDGERVAEGPFRSFEHYRRTLLEPEIITYDELLERAKYILKDAEASQ